MADEPHVASGRAAENLSGAPSGSLTARSWDLASSLPNTVPVQVDLGLEPSEGALTLVGAAFFSTADAIYERRSWFGLVEWQYRVNYGLVGGDLRVELKNARAPIGERYAPAMAMQMQQDVSTDRSESTERGGAGGIKDGILSLAWSLKRTRSVGRKRGLVAQLLIIAAKGDDDCPTWEYRSGDGVPLFGSAPASGETLAKLTSLGPNVSARAGFWVDDRHIKCWDIQPLGGASAKARAVVEQAFPQRLFEKWRGAGVDKVLIATKQVQFSTIVPGDSAVASEGGAR